MIWPWHGDTLPHLLSRPFTWNMAKFICAFWENFHQVTICQPLDTTFGHISITTFLSLHHRLSSSLLMHLGLSTSYTHHIQSPLYVSISNVFFSALNSHIIPIHATFPCYQYMHKKTKAKTLSCQPQYFHLIITCNILNSILPCPKTKNSLYCIRYLPSYWCLQTWFFLYLHLFGLGAIKEVHWT